MPALPDEAALYPWLLAGMAAVAACAFIALFFVSAAYGRHAREGWGPTVRARLGWILMEAPSPLIFGALWWTGDPERRFSAPSLAFLALWMLHYVHRAFIYPFRVRAGRPNMPLAIAALGATFNLFNAYLNARWLFTLGPAREPSWLLDPRFLVGLALFAAGYFINQQSDHILLNLRKPGETGYRVPHGGLYRFVSCPNYLGELIEWSGFALLTWSPGALLFVVWTAANLVPRARTHHAWYKERFPDYPPERRAILPGLY